MNINQLMQNAAKAYEQLQSLGIQPTKSNMLILVRTLQTLEDVYKYLKSEADKADTEVEGDG